MNRFKNKPDLLDTIHYDALVSYRSYDLSKSQLPNPIYGLGFFGDDNYGEVYQDLYDMLSDDYRGGYHGERKTKLLLYIVHRAYREYGVIVHTGSGFSPLDADDTHHGDPADIAAECDDYPCDEDIREYLCGIR